MTVLAIETATAACGAAIIRDGKVAAEQSLHAPHVHSEKLLTLIDRVVRSAGDYDVIAVSIGPGSFTGLRIGLSAAKGLAFSRNKRIVAVPTMEALAFRAVWENSAGQGDKIVAMIDARRNDVYAAVYRVEGDGLINGFGPEAVSLGSLLQRIADERKTVLMGDGVGKFISFHASKEMDSWVVPPPELRTCSAAAVGLVGSRKARLGEFADGASLEPLYGREFWSMVASQHPSS